MASSPRTVEREEERGLNMRTLVIASAASASAAAITSQLWIRGTWIAAAVTPVFVAILSELLNRPTEKIAKVMTSDTPRLTVRRGAGEPESPEPKQPTRPEPREPTPSEPLPGGPAAPVRVYRQPPRRPSRRHIAWGAVLATAGLAFVIGVVVLTTTELIAGESIGKSDSRTTLVGGKSNKDRDSESEKQTPTDTSERTTPERDQEQAPDRTQPTTPDETTTQQTTPEETTTQQSTTPEEPAPRSAPPAGEPQATP